MKKRCRNTYKLQSPVRTEPVKQQKMKPSTVRTRLQIQRAAGPHKNFRVQHCKTNYFVLGKINPAKFQPFSTFLAFQRM